MAKSQLTVVVYDDEKYYLPIIFKGRQITDDERLRIAELVCRIYAKDQYSLTQCLEMCGIKSRSTWFRWVQEMEQIEQLYRIAQKEREENYRKRIVEATKDTVMKLASGGYVKKLKTEERVYQVIDGQKIEVGQKTTTKEIFVKPSTALLMTILESAEPENYSKRLNLERFETSTGDSLEDIIMNLHIDDTKGEEKAAPPITSEREAREYGRTLKRPNFG